VRDQQAAIEAISGQPRRRAGIVEGRPLPAPLTRVREFLGLMPNVEERMRSFVGGILGRRKAALGESGKAMPTMP